MSDIREEAERAARGARATADHLKGIPLFFGLWSSLDRIAGNLERAVAKDRERA